MIAMVEISFTVVVPTVVRSRVDMPVLVSVEVVARKDVGVAVAKVEEMFSDVLRVTANVVDGSGLVLGVDKDVPAGTAVGRGTVSVAVMVTVAAVDVPAGLEVTALFDSAAGLVISAFLDVIVEVLSEPDVCPGLEEGETVVSGVFVDWEAKMEVFTGVVVMPLLM